MPVNETVERIIYEGVDRISAVSKQSADAVKTLRQGLDQVKGALAAVGVTVGAGAMLTLYKDTLKAVSALDDMAESTGATVEGLSAIQRVAKVGGHDFEGLTGQIGKMIRGLKESSEEGGKAARALDFLGVKARDAQGRYRDTSAVLLEVAQRLHSYATDGEKVAFIQDVLGKGAERYLPLLKEMAEATDLHATATAKQAQEANEAEKNIRRLTLAFEDSRRELVNEYTPAIGNFFEKLLEARRATGNIVAGGLMAAFNGNDLRAELRQVEAELADIQKNSGPGAQAANIFTWGVSGAMTGMQESRLLQKQEFLQKMLARQERATAKSGTTDPNSPLFEFGGQPLNYKPSDAGFSAEDIKRRQQEVIDATIRAGNDRDKIQKALNPFYMTDEEKEKAGAEWVKSIIEMRDDVNAKIARFTMNPTMDDDVANPQRDARLVAFRETLKSEEQLELESHQIRMAQFEEFTHEELSAYGGRLALMEGMNAQHQARLIDIATRKNQAQRSMEMGTLQLGAGLLQQFAGKSKAAALAVIAISKGLHIAQTVQATAAATMRAYSDLGPVAGTAAAAYIQSLGAVQIGLIAATGLVEASQVGKGPTPQGTFSANPSTGLPAAPEPAATSAAASSPLTTVINVPQGRRLFTIDDMQDLFEMMNEAARKGGRLERVIIRQS